MNVACLMSSVCDNIYGAVLGGSNKANARESSKESLHDYKLIDWGSCNSMVSINAEHDGRRLSLI